MSLTLHFHPLASYCHKALIALYENDTPFAPNLVNLGDEHARAVLLKLWPIGKFPVLCDDERDRTIPESTGQQGSARRRGGESAAADRLSHDRSGDGAADLGGGR
jgi:Glutathione S-transferase, N-terminal domain